MEAATVDTRAEPAAPKKKVSDRAKEERKLA